MTAAFAVISLLTGGTSVIRGADRWNRGPFLAAALLYPS
jgi:hypothetical protein